MRHNPKRLQNRVSVPLLFIILLMLILPSPLYSGNNDRKPGSKSGAVKNKRGSGKYKSRVKPSKKNDKNDKKAKKKNKDEKIDDVDDTINLKNYKEEDFKPTIEEESYSWLVIKTVLILGSIVGLFYVFMKYVTKKAGIQVLGEEAIKVLSMVPVGQNKYLQIIDIADKIFVLGVADNSINLIAEISDKNEKDRIRMLSSKSSSARGKGFQDYLNRYIGNIFDRMSDKKKKGKKTDDLSNYSDSDFDLDYLKRQKKRLRNLNNFNNE